MAPELILLDVGHGNCALVAGQDTAVVIDAPRGGVHGDALKNRSIREVHAVVISHADADHMGGVTSLLYDEDVRVHTVYVNPDATKTSGGGGPVWKNFLIALRDAERRNELKVSSIHRGDQIDLHDTRIRLEVLAPTTEFWLLGVGGTTEKGTLTPNSLSVVVRVWFDENPIALLPGDLDAQALEKLLDEDEELNAQLMVFPHHGGNTGGDNREFASLITKAVKPEIIAFSFGRHQASNPRPEIIDSVRSARPDVRIMCTQLSKRCSESTLDPQHIAPLPAKGRFGGNCCAGSLQFDPVGLVAPSAEEHADFVDDYTTSPLCRRELP